MNTADRPQHDFDAGARQLHRQALECLDPATLARLRAARREAAAQTRPVLHRRGLWLATSCSALLALGLGIQLNRTAPTPAGTAQQVAAVASQDSDEILDQNPDLYVWLSSENALAMEQTP